MKKCLFLICILFISALFVFVGCTNDNPNTDDNTKPGTVKLDDVIFGGDFKIVVPENITIEEYNYVLKLDDVVYDLTGAGADIKNDSTAEYAHEILIGRTNRPISEKAYKRLQTLKGEGSDYIGYVVYSDGESIAVAYDSMDSMDCIKTAVTSFADSYLSKDYGKQTVKSGVLLEWKYELEKLYDERDEQIMEERFAKLEKEINEKGYDGKETVKAIRGLYSMYTDNIYMWMADLYEPEIPCSCAGECAYGGNHGGGFYYSNSGRNTVGFLPDIESTMQILNFLRNTGMTYNLNNLPENFKKQIVTFVKSTQSPVDGYFYHPQWEGMETTDERRGRDQKWAIEILRTFGERPFYTTGGVEGSIGVPGASATAHLVTPLRFGYKAELSKVVACATLEHLQSEEAFKEYLDSQNWDDAYTTGNRIGAQSTSIKAAGLLDFCIEYLNGKQKENGMWDNQLGERATNGFLKIAGIYQDAGVVIPRSKEASEFCIELLLSDEPDGTVCWTYNVWYALDIITRLLDSSGKAEDAALSDEIRDTLRKNAPEYIKTTTEKYLTFLKDDGTFSFTPDKTSSHSQGMPVAVMGKNEGDVNATTISSVGVTGYMFSALGYGKVELFTENDYKLFIDRIIELEPVIKNNSSMSGGIDFEDISINDVFNATSNVAVGITPDGFTEAEIDENWAYTVITDDNSGKALEYAKPNAGFETRIEFANKSRNSTRHIYEFDMKFMGGDVENGSWHTRFAMYNNSKRFWYLLCYTLDDGTLALGDRNEPIAVLNPNEWYNIRFEYYTDTSDRACKIYIDGEYVGEGGTSDSSSGDAAISRTFVEYRNEATGVAYRFDNILVSSDDEPYIPPFVDAGDALGTYYCNADYKGKRYDYDIEEPVLPALLKNVGSLSVIDGRLHFNLKSAGASDALIYDLPISAAQKDFENLCKIFELEFSYSDIKGDKPFSIMLGNQEYSLVKDTATGNLNIVDKYNDNKIIALDLAPDTVYVLRFECYAFADNDTYNITKLYVDEEYAGELRSRFNNAVTKLSIVMDGALAGTDAYVAVENVLLVNIDREYVRDESEAPDEGGDIETAEPSPFGGGVFYKGTVDSNRFDYTNILSGLQTDGVTSGSDDTAICVNGVLVYTRNNINGESYMRWNHSKPAGLTTPVFVFESDFRFDGFKGNTPQQKIIVQANGISHQITPAFAEADGVQTMTIGKMTLNEGTWYNIRFELDYNAGNIYYFLNGEYVGFEYLAKVTTTYQRIIWYYMTKQTGGSMSFDNTFEGFVEDGTVCESHIDENEDGVCDNCPLEIPKEEEPKPEINIPENTAGGGAYYSGTEDGNRFNCNEENGNLKIDGITANDEAIYQNGMLIFNRNNDTGKGESYLRWNLPSGTDKIFIFETDFYFTGFAEAAQTSLLRFLITSGCNYTMKPSVSADGKIMTVGKFVLSSDTWYNLRFEIEAATGNTNYFLNGEFVGAGTLAVDSASYTGRVLWYYLGAQTSGTMVFDNTFTGFVGKGTAVVCEEHTDSDLNGLCDICGATIEITPPPISPEDPTDPIDPDNNGALGATDDEDNTDQGGWIH